MAFFSLFRLFSRNNKKHWDYIYKRHSPNELGWYQERTETSLNMIRVTGADADACIIDIGGGASRLSEQLLEKGYYNLTVFDISSLAMKQAKRSLGEKAAKITWIEGDITSYVFGQQYEIWHDRAVFHFLTSRADREKYLQSLEKSLTGNGYFIIATFTPEAPPKCSGLPVVRYTAESLRKEVGPGFDLIHSVEELHQTPNRTIQKFIYCLFRRAC